MRRLDRIQFYYNDTAIAGELAVNTVADDQSDAHEIYESLLGESLGPTGEKPAHHMSGSHIYELVESETIHFELLSPDPKSPVLSTSLEYISDDIEGHVSEALSPWNVDVSLDYRQEKYAVSPSDILTGGTDKEMMESLASEYTDPDSSVYVFLVDADGTSDAGEYFPRKASAYVRVPNREPEVLESRVEHELGHSLNLKHNTHPKGIWQSRRGALRTEMLMDGDVSLEIEESALKQKIHPKEIDRGRLESEHVESARNLLRTCGVEEEELELSYEYSYAEATNPGFEDALRMEPEDSAERCLMLELGESDYNLFLHSEAYQDRVL